MGSYYPVIGNWEDKMEPTPGTYGLTPQSEVARTGVAQEFGAAESNAARRAGLGLAAKPGVVYEKDPGMVREFGVRGFDTAGVLGNLRSDSPLVQDPARHALNGLPPAGLTW